MVRLAISVEGQSEEEFVKRLVAPHLSRHGIFAVPIILKTGRTPSGTKAKGGAVNLDRVVHEARILLGSFAYVTTLYDLYGFGGREMGTSAAAIEARLAEALEAPRNFLPYVQEYELEALLLSDPSLVESYFRAEGKGMAEAIRQVIAAAGGAEKVNDGPDTAPSKRLGAWCQTYSNERYDGGTKRRHSVALAELVTLARMRGECPRFANWIARLETLR